MFPAPLSGFPISALATSSAPGLIRALSGNAAQYLDGTGNWSSPSGTVASAAILAPATSARNLITPTAIGATPLTLAGMAGQTAPVLVVQDNTPTTLLSVASNGFLSLTGVIRPVVDSTTGIQIMKAANANVVAVFDTTNRRVGFGATPGNVHVQITGFSDDMQFMVRGNSSQTQPLSQWQTAAAGGTVVTTLDASGNWDMLQTLRVRGHSIMGANISSVDTHFVLAMAEQFTSDGSSNYSMIDVTATAVAGYASGIVYGGGFEGINGSASSVNWIGGASGHAIQSALGTVALAFGLQALVEVNTAAGVITAGRGIQVQMVGGSAGSITTAAGFYYLRGSISGGFTIGTLYGLYMEAVDQGSTNYAIYTNAGTVRFGSLTASLAVFTDASSNLVTNTLTGTGNVVMSASPTLTGTIIAAAANFSGAVGVGGNASGAQLDVNSGATQSVVAFRRTQTTNATGATMTLYGAASGTTIRGYFGFTHQGSGADTIFTGEGANNIALRAENSLLLGGGGDHIAMTITNGQILISAVNIATDTTTGTKIGTLGGAAGQKLGFFNATPIVQPVLATGAANLVDNVITVLQNLGLVRQS